MDGLAVQRRAVARDRAEQLVAQRVDDDAHGRLAADDEADAGAEVRDAGGVVHGAVEGVDDPDPVSRLDRCAGAGSVDRPSPGRAPGMARFLGQDLVVRERPPDGRDDRLLREVVGLGDHVPGALLDDVLQPLVVLDLDGRGGAGGLDGDGELGGIGRRGGR